METKPSIYLMPTGDRVFRMSCEDTTIDLNLTGKLDLDSLNSNQRRLFTDFQCRFDCEWDLALVQRAQSAETL